MEEIYKIFENSFAKDFIGSLLRIIIVIVFAKIILNVVLKLLGNAEKRNLRAGKQSVEHFVKPLLKISIYFIALLIIFSEFGIDVSSLLALFSVFSAALALAAQSVLSQLFGGFTLIINKPFSVGDYIDTGNYEGRVRSIGLYYTVLVTADNRTISIPNGTLSTCDIVNYSNDGIRRIKVKVGAGYDCKVEDVKAALQYAISLTPNLLKEPEPYIGISSYDSSDIKYTIKAFVSNDDFSSEYELIGHIKEGFDKYNVYMSYDHIVVHNAKD